MSNNINKSQILQWIKAVSETIKENKDYLTDLDAAIGDADHGINMERGFSKVLEKFDSYKDKPISDIFKAIAMTLMSTVGGASGPLYGRIFRKMSVATKDTPDSLTSEELYQALKDGIDGVMEIGGAKVGDKTMVDVWVPALEVFRNELGNGSDLKTIMEKVVSEADKQVEATIPLVARKGRASYLGERSAGHQDPGATSSDLILKALASVVE